MLFRSELAKKSFGGGSGARDLRNAIRREVEDKIAAMLVERGGISAVGVTAKEGGLLVEAI